MRKTRLELKAEKVLGFPYEIVDCTRMVFIRVQATIRADGTPSAQVATLQGCGSHETAAYMRIAIERVGEMTLLAK